MPGATAITSSASFNADKPYDRFLLEQFAGDELADYEHAATVTQELFDNLVATGFLRMAPDSTIEHNISFVDDRLDVIADEIDVLGSGVMGLTIRCARCHSHKYDPIPQRDYYRLKAVFKGAYDEHDWLNPHASVYDKPEEYRAPVLRFLPYIPPNATPVEILEQRRAAEELNHNLDLEIRDPEKGPGGEGCAGKETHHRPETRAVARGHPRRLEETAGDAGRQPHRSSKIPGGEVRTGRSRWNRTS